MFPHQRWGPRCDWLTFSQADVFSFGGLLDVLLTPPSPLSQADEEEGETASPFPDGAVSEFPSQGGHATECG